MSKIKDAVYARGYVYNFHFHLIWVTKYRHTTFVNQHLVNEMKAILQYICSLHDIKIEKMEVMPDHVHMLISFPPKYSATNVVKALKGGVHAFSYTNTPKSKRVNTGAVTSGHAVITWALWAI